MGRTILILLTLGLLGSGCLQERKGTGGQLQHGRPNFGPEEMAKKQTDEITELISLTAEQKDKLYEINLDHTRSMKALREDETIEREERRVSHMELNKKREEKFKDLFSEEQYMLWEKVREDLKPRRKRTGPPPSEQ